MLVLRNCALEKIEPVTSGMNGSPTAVFCGVASFTRGRMHVFSTEANPSYNIDLYHEAEMVLMESRASACKWTLQLCKAGQQVLLQV